MEKHEFFSTEIAHIESEEYKDFVRFYLDERVPSYFWEIGASSSGKFHPTFSQGYGGLVRHTKAVCLFCEELLKMSQWAYLTDERKDLARIACIVHDTAKYGIGDYNKAMYSAHAENAASLVNAAWQDFFNGAPCPYELYQAIQSHMGQWSTEKDHRPFTPVDRLVHLSDYIASRNFIDIPVINFDYDKTAEIAEADDNELPF